MKDDLTKKYEDLRQRGLLTEREINALKKLDNDIANDVNAPEWVKDRYKYKHNNTITCKYEGDRFTLFRNNIEITDIKILTDILSNHKNKDSYNFNLKNWEETTIKNGKSSFEKFTLSDKKILCPVCDELSYLKIKVDK